MKKKFDVMKWLREVRERNYQRDRGLSPEQLIERTLVAAVAFDASRPRKLASTSRR